MVLFTGYLIYLIPNIAAVVVAAVSAMTVWENVTPIKKEILNADIKTKTTENH